MQPIPAVRIASATEESLHHCIEHSLWAARRSLPRNWSAGDILVVRVETSVAGIARVIGPLKEDRKVAFSQDFPVVAPVEWLWAAQRIGDRVTFGEWLKTELRDAWGSHYGFRVLNQSALPEQNARRVLAALAERISDLASRLRESGVEAEG